MRKRKDGFSGERALVLPFSVVTEMERDPLASALHITDIGYYPHASNHYRERRNPIMQYVLLYCVDGKGWAMVNKVRHTIGKNQFIILPADKPHSYGADEEEPWTIYWIHFKGKMAPQYVPEVTRPLDVKPGIYSRISNRLDLFEEIYNTLEMGYSKESISYACSVFYHFMGSLRFLISYRSALRIEQGKEREDVITASIHYMKENIEKKLSLQEIADHLGYSLSHFCALFREHTGYSPHTLF